MERITISIEPALLERFDRYIEGRGYTNRSEGVRDAIRQLLADERIETNDAEPCVGCVTYVYNHHERELSSRLVEAQHHHHDVPVATMHLHIDPENCLEATVLKGSVAEVRQMADKMTSQTGVKNGRLHMIPLGDLTPKA